MTKNFHELNNILDELAKQEEARGFNSGIENAAGELFDLAKIAFQNEKDGEAKLLRDLAKQILLLQKNYDIGAWEKVETWIENNK